MEGDWKCPECTYTSQSEAELERHMKTIAHSGIEVESENVSKHSEPENKETVEEGDCTGRDSAEADGRY